MKEKGKVSLDYKRSRYIEYVIKEIHLIYSPATLTLELTDLHDLLEINIDIV